MLSKVKLLFLILLGLICLISIVLLLFLYASNPKKIMPPTTTSTISKDMSQTKSFTFNRDAVSNGFTLTFSRGDSGIFIATLKRVYEENNKIYLDITFNENKSEINKKILILSKDVSGMIFVLTRSSTGELASATNKDTLSISYNDAIKQLSPYINQDLAFFISSTQPPPSGSPNSADNNLTPSETELIYARANCNLPFFQNIVNSEYKTLACIPYILSATVRAK